MIEGWGIAVDAVVADFIAGAAERLVLQGSQDADVVLVEGQGSINHPGYSGVTLGPAARLLPRRDDPLPPVEPGVHRRLSRGAVAPDPAAVASTSRLYETIGAAVHPTKVIGDLAQHVRPDRRRGPARLRGGRTTRPASPRPIRSGSTRRRW